MTKKTTFTICSLISAVLLSGVYLLPIELPFYALTMVILIALFVQWIFLIRIFQYRIVVSKLLFYFLYTAGQYYFLSVFPTLGLAAQLLFIVGTSVLAYAILLALNVYFVSEKQESDIPLIQPAKVVVTAALVLMVFFWTTLLYKLSFAIVLLPAIGVSAIMILIFFLFFFCLLYPLSWFVLPQRVGEVSEEKMQMMRRALIFTVIIMWELSVLFMGFPFETFARAALLSVSAYVSITIVSHYLSHRLSRRLYVESAVILFATYIFVYLI